ncbi:hypothetical protein ACK3SF_01325 [Candidatus Nanosalina sp. VS9-1]|uniref:hypothetical protein n=1 Tax=Candidatus Nanosalina sp. VS9-1 TaxID=3388566 RepID=UPI0039E0E2DB
MDIEEDVDYQRLELDAEKLMFLGVTAVVLLGIGIAGSISLEAGHVVQAILGPTTVSSNWAGVSGDISGFQEETASPIDYFYAGDSRSGSVTDLSLEGQNDGRHFFGALPFHDEEFESGRVGNLSLSDLDAGGLFDEEDFPVFYPNGTSYDEVTDNPEKTFEDTENIKLLGSEFKALKTTLNGGVNYYMLGYDINGTTQPVFVAGIDSYSSCYDGEDCDYQLMLPRIDDDYSFYMLSESDPVRVTTLVDGVESRSFPYAGRPYNLTVITKDVFDNYSPVDTGIRITEREGNNLFTPAISQDYSSEAQIITETVNGSRSLMYTPTAYNSPSNYNLTVDVYSDGETIQSVPLSVENSNIEFTDSGPAEKGFEDLETDYKKGVNRLRPVANCLFSNVNSDEAYRLDVTGNESFEVVRGIPYIVDVTDSEASYFSLEERGSHLVMLPARNADTLHLESGGSPYAADSSIVFTPTVSKDGDDQLDIEVLDSQGDLLGETNLSVKGSTCGSPTDGLSAGVPNSKSFKKRVNAIRPVLNSLFVAGN